MVAVNHSQNPWNPLNDLLHPHLLLRSGVRLGSPAAGRRVDLAPAMTEPQDTESTAPPENPAKSLREWEAFFAKWGQGQKPVLTMEDF